MNKLLIFLLIASSPLSVIYFPGLVFISITPYRIVFPIAIILIVLRLLLTRRLAIHPTILKLIALIVVIYTLSYLRYDAPFKDAANFAYFRAILFYIAITVTIIIVNTERKLNLAIRYLLVTSVIIASLGWIDAYLRYMFQIDIWNYVSRSEIKLQYLAATYTAEGMLVPRLTSTFYDCNLFAYYLFLPLGILANSVILKQKSLFTKSYNIDTFLLTFLAITIFATVSRSGILCCAFLFIYILYKTRIKTSKKLLRTITFLISLCIIYVLVSFLMEVEFLSVLSDRIATESGHLHRYLRAQGGYKAFLSNILFGVGLGNLGHYLPYGIRKAEIITSHSLYLDILASCGMLGFILFASFLGFMLLKLHQASRFFPDQINISFFATVFSLSLTQIVYANLYHPALAIQFGLILSYINIKFHFRTKSDGPYFSPNIHHSLWNS